MLWKLSVAVGTRNGAPLLFLTLLGKIGR